MHNKRQLQTEECTDYDSRQLGLIILREVMVITRTCLSLGSLWVVGITVFKMLACFTVATSSLIDNDGLLPKLDYLSTVVLSDNVNLLNPEM